MSSKTTSAAPDAYGDAPCDRVSAAALPRQREDNPLSVRERDLDWTIVRPGTLTDYPGTGRVLAGSNVPGGSIPREDVAATIAALLESGAASRTQFDLVSGDDPIAEALANLG